MNQAADTLLSILRSVTLPPEQELPFISFVARTLEYLVLSEPKYQEMVTALVTTAIRLGAHVNVAAADVIDTVIISTQKREALVKPVIHELLKEELKRPFSPSRSFAAYVCSGRHGSSPIVHSRMLRRGHFVRMWRPSFRSEASSTSSYFGPLNIELKQSNFERAVKDANEARLYILIYGDQRFQLVKRHGIRALIGDGPHLVFAYLNDMLLDVVDEIIELNLYDSKRGDREDCLNVIDHIVDNCHNRVPRVVSNREIRGTPPERIDWIVRNIYSIVLEQNKRRRRGCDWGRVVLVLAIYLDIVCLKERQGKRPHAEIGGDGRLSEFMPAEPMKALMRGLKSSSVLEQIESWNHGEVTFSE
jgi:hypothetical protein